MTRALTAPINELTAAARAKGAMVIFTQFVIGRGFTTDSPMWLGMHANAGLKSLDQERFYTVEGSWGAQLCEDVIVAPTDHIIKKYRSSAFKDTALEFLLKQRGIKTLIIAGQVTEGCVENTIRASRDADYYTVLAKDAIGSTSKERHDRVMAGWLGRTPCPTTAEIVAVWSGGG
jgi:nicotinamidase-related amidase